MVINSININKASNNLWTELTEHRKTTTYDVENSGSGLGQAQKSGRVKPISVFYHDE
jgi:hypothetical protein